MMNIDTCVNHEADGNENADMVSVAMISPD